MRAGEYARITPATLRAIRQKHGLTQAQVALLARTSVFKTRGGALQARRIQAWESGENRIPLANWELLCIKLRLLESNLATFEELATEPLMALLDAKQIRFYKRQRGDLVGSNINVPVA